MERLRRLREQMSESEAFYITSCANIFYYSGFTSEDAALMITQDNAVLITDSRYIVQAKRQAIDFEIFDISHGLKKIISKIGAKEIGYEENYLTVAGLNKIKNVAHDIKFHCAGEKISKPRQIKEPVEIEKIKAAEQLGDEAFRYLLKHLSVGMTELEVAFELEMFMRKNGASQVSFDTIVASGWRSAMPHGVASGKIIENGDFVTMDFGCVLDGYCSDMTRTVLMGKASERQKEIYNVVLEAQKKALKCICVGMLCKDVDAVARNVISEAGYGQYFSHSLGHSVGIEIHEYPNFSTKSDDVVTCGNVITVEPGIYIEDFGGVRIEDIVAITPKNVENLTKSEKELIII